MGSQNYSGERFGQYELGDLLGVGGMGAVYRAYQAGLKRTVAVKVLPLMRGEDYAKRFIREATTSAALEHAHIIPIYDFGTERGVSYIVMRLLTGGSLADRIDTFLEEGKPLPTLREIGGFVRQLASALDYAHGKGVVHRDIKPSNVMFDEQGAAYLVDFGIAKLSNATGGLTGTNMTVGTPQYMPPEQWRGEEVVPASDQYALAVMVYHLVTGRLPFEAPTPFALMHKHVYETPTPPTFFRADLPQAIPDVLNRAMAKTPAGRYPSVGAFAQAFEEAAQSAPALSVSSATGIFVKPLPPTSPNTATQAVRSPAQPGVNKTTRTRIVPIAAGGTVIVVAFVALGLLIAQAIFQPTRPTNTPLPTIESGATVAIAAAITATDAPPPITATPPPPQPTSIPPTATNTAIPPTPTRPPPTIGGGTFARQTVNAVNTINAEVTSLFLIEAANLTATAQKWTPTPSVTPSSTPTAAPSVTPSVTPTVTPSVTPTDEPTAIILPSPWTNTPRPITLRPSATPTTDTADETIREITRTGTRTIVRAQASASAAQVAVLFVGDRFRATGKTSGLGANQWYEIELADGRTGWIQPRNGATKEVDPNETTPGLNVGVRVSVTSAGGGLNMRANPSTSARLVKNIDEGTRLVIIDGPTRGGFHMWWKYQLADGTQGWIIDIADWLEIE
jgi:hypothetical protein